MDINSKKPAKLKKPPVSAVTVVTPNGVIRRGQRKPYKKSTNEEVSARVELVADYIASQPLIHNHEVRKWIEKEFNISWRFADEYIRRARVVISKRSNMSRSEVRELVTNFLFDTLKSGDKNKSLRAAEQLRDIFGLDAPKKHMLGDPDGRPLAPAVVAPTVIFQIPDNNRQNGSK